MWIANGFIPPYNTNLDDAQYSRDGKNWVLTYVGTAPWLGYNAGSPFIVFNNRLWMIADPTGAFSAPSSVYYTTGEQTDIGLRVYDGTSVVRIAAEASLLSSPLRIAKNGNIYGIVLVPTTDPTASKIRIETSSGIKALKRI